MNIQKICWKGRSLEPAFVRLTAQQKPVLWISEFLLRSQSSTDPKDLKLNLKNKLQSWQSENKIL